MVSFKILSIGEYKLLQQLLKSNAYEVNRTENAIGDCFHI